MTPASAPLPSLPHHPEHGPLLVPVLGQGARQGAAKALRGIASMRQPRRLSTVQLRPALFGSEGKRAIPFPLSARKDGVRPLLFAFPDDTVLLGAQQGDLTTLYPQPLAGLRPSGSLPSLLKSGGHDFLDALVATTLAAPPVALSAEAAFGQDHHWATWQPLDLWPAARTRGMVGSLQDVQRWIALLLQVFPPPDLPPDTPFVNVRVDGRVRTLDGFTEVKARVADTSLHQRMPDWCAKLERSAAALFAGDAVAPVWATLRQTLDGEGAMRPYALFDGALPFPPPLSGHARLSAAATLPDGVLQA